MTIGDTADLDPVAIAKNANGGSAPEPKQVKHGSQVIANGILDYVPMFVEFKGERNCDEGQSRCAFILPFLPREKMARMVPWRRVPGDLGSNRPERVQRFLCQSFPIAINGRV